MGGIDRPGIDVNFGVINICAQQDIDTGDVLLVCDCEWKHTISRDELLRGDLNLPNTIVREHINKEHTMGLEEIREFYTHDATCTGKKFHPENDRGLRTCKECSGVFDKAGKGVAVTDKRFDERM